MHFSKRSGPTQYRAKYKQALPSYTLAEAKRKIMDLLSERDHSEKEILKKLKRRCDETIAAQALQWAKEQNWLPSEAKVQEMVVHSLGRRKKGQRAINQKLKEMGLKPVKLDSETELEKALEALEIKFRAHLLSDLDFKSAQKEKARVLRFLLGRGFDSSVAVKAFQVYFKKQNIEEIDTEVYDDSE